MQDDQQGRSGVGRGAVPTTGPSPRPSRSTSSKPPLNNLPESSRCFAGSGRAFLAGSDGSVGPDRCGDGDGRAHENVHQGLVLAGRGTRPPGASWCRECISLSRRRFRPLLSRAGWASRRERGRPHPTRGGYGAPFHSARRAGQRVPEQRALHHQGRPRPDPAVQGRPGHPRLHRRLIGTTGAVRPTGHSNCCRFWRSGRIVRVGTPDALGGFRVIPRFWRWCGGVRGGTILPERHVPPRTGSAGRGPGFY